MPALPGAPAERPVDGRARRLRALGGGEARGRGLDACIVENVGDVPLFRDHVPPATVAAMAVLVTEVRRATKMKVGVNILRNACTEALSIAEVCGADFIRCNVVIGAYVTDQGIIQGCAAELARLRRSLGSEVLIFGDVHVKHAHPAVRRADRVRRAGSRRARRRRRGDRLRAAEPDPADVGAARDGQGGGASCRC